jgi:hypothetical protein
MRWFPTGGPACTGSAALPSLPAHRAPLGRLRKNKSPLPPWVGAPGAPRSKSQHSRSEGSCVRVDFTHLYLSLPRALSLSLSLSLSDACARALSLTLKKNSVGRVLLAARRLCPRGVRVGVWRTGRLSVFQRCRVGYAWTLGLVRRLVALSGLLLRWLSRAFGSYCLGGGWVPKCS